MTGLEAFTRPLFAIGAFPLSAGDLLGFATGLLCVALAARGHILNFPLGLANCAILGMVFFQARLYGDMTLQALFFALTAAGWIQWLRAPGGAAARARPWAPRDAWLGILAVAALILPLRGLLIRLGGAAPWADAFITCASAWAQWLLNRKAVSTWPWWIAIDLISIPLYLARKLPLIAALYTLFLVLCIRG